MPLVNWRLISATGSKLAFGREGKKTFILPNNRADVENAQPPHFKKFKLRPEQLRSLTWMIAQEKNPTPWVEEEVAEAILPQLGWYAEAKATRNVLVRGGVLADEGAFSPCAMHWTRTDAFAFLQSDTARLPSPSASSIRSRPLSSFPPTSNVFPSRLLSSSFPG